MYKRQTIDGAIAKFKGKATTDDARFAAVADGMNAIGEHFASHVNATEKHQADTKTALDTMASKVAELEQKYSVMDNTEQPGRRPPASGGQGDIKTDC